jgi:hypothetical protein
MTDRITVNKADLLSRLQENRDKHRKVFEAAVDGFVEDVQVQLKQTADRLRRGKISTISIHLPRPEDHTMDYDRVILMVQMSLGDTYDLSENDFAKYVMDDWAWKREWNRMSSHYAAASFSETYGAIEDTDN